MFTVVLQDWDHLDAYHTTLERISLLTGSPGSSLPSTLAVRPQTQQHHNSQHKNSDCEHYVFDFLLTSLLYLQGVK